jgi:hypothetical protein
MTSGIFVQNGSRAQAVYQVFDRSFAGRFEIAEESQTFVGQAGWFRNGHSPDRAIKRRLARLSTMSYRRKCATQGSRSKRAVQAAALAAESLEATFLRSFP